MQQTTKFISVRDAYKATSFSTQFTDSQASKQNGSRTRLLNAAKLCCCDQYLLTLSNLEDEHFPVSELHWYTDNDISAIMKRKLSEKFYVQFLTIAWGTDLTSQFLFQ